MSEYSYFAASRSSINNTYSHAVWKVGPIVALGTSADNDSEPWITASISREPEYFEGVPAFLMIDKVKKCTKEAFNKYYNENFQALQKLKFHDGEYYLERSESGDKMYFHAFYRSPSRHYMIDLIQYENCVDICLSTERSLLKRRGIANSCRLLPEGVFCQAFKLVLEFFYDGSAMPKTHNKLWETLDALVGSTAPDEPLLINDEYYYLRARELMLKRKEEIKTRLLELDDVPSKRRELRAEMKGIDYCVSILDKNH